MAKPFGQAIVGAIVAIIALVGLGIGVVDCWGEFKQRLELKQSQRQLRIGLAVRSVMFTMIIGVALTANSREAKGFAGALHLIQQQSYGSVLLGITAAGLLAFGIYGLAEGAFGRVAAPSLRQAAAKGGLARR